MNAESLIAMRQTFVGQMTGLIDECTGFSFSIKRPEKQMPEQPGDTMMRFEPGDETVITITLRHDENPPAAFIRNPPADTLQGVKIEGIKETMGDTDGSTDGEHGKLRTGDEENTESGSESSPESDTESNDDKSNGASTASESCGLAE